MPPPQPQAPTSREDEEETPWDELDDEAKAELDRKRAAPLIQARKDAQAAHDAVRAREHTALEAAHAQIALLEAKLAEVEAEKTKEAAWAGYFGDLVMDLEAKGRAVDALVAVLRKAGLLRRLAQE